MKRLVLAVVGIVVVIMVAWWFLPGPWMVLRPPAEGDLMRNGVAAVVVCGRMRESAHIYGPLNKYAPRVNTGVWATQRKGECTVWFHLQSGE